MLRCWFLILGDSEPVFLPTELTLPPSIPFHRIVLPSYFTVPILACPCCPSVRRLTCHRMLGLILSATSQRSPPRSSRPDLLIALSPHPPRASCPAFPHPSSPSCGLASTAGLRIGSIRYFLSTLSRIRHRLQLRYSLMSPAAAHLATAADPDEDLYASATADATAAEELAPAPRGGLTSARAAGSCATRPPRSGASSSTPLVADSTTLSRSSARSRH